MVTRNADSSQALQGDGALMCELPGPADQPRSRAGNMVFKSGPLYISSKGIGWTSWKKRWFILTRTSLVFFRSDPSVIPQRGSEVNLTLGGIDLNNSGSVVIRADKKLLTVLFPDGRDGRAFTLKAETSEDLYEWKAALENALAQAPSAALVLGQNGIFRNDPVDAVDGSSEQGKDKHAIKSLVVGRPLLLALEDIDGSPSFLEKALRFVEQHGVKVEGILRQAADVEDVERRVREYEQGKSEFSPEEDPHVIADCVKHVLRELPSSPVPASCCNALLEACRTDRGVRVSSMRAAIYETFPEPNRHLLQRILMMMQAVASNKSENRMSTSAVAACMAPLLLRPLLAGDCEPENGFDMEGDSSVQLLQAAAAANHAQAIVITLLEDYDKIFGEDSMSPGLQSESEGSGSEDDSTDDDEVLEDDGYHDTEQDIFADADDDPEHELSGTCSEGSGTRDNDLYHKVQDHEGSDLDSGIGEYFEANWKQTSIAPTSLPVHDSLCIVDSSVLQSNMSESLGSGPAATSPVHMLRDHSLSSNINKSAKKSNGPMPGVKRPTVWGRTAAKKNLSMESIDYVSEDDVEIQRLEVTRTDLQNRIAKEAKGNALLQASLERRKLALHERRLALERDVARLQEQLQREKELRAALEGGLKMALDHFPVSATIDDKTKAEIEEIALAEADIISLKQKVDSLHVQLSQQREENSGSEIESSRESQQKSNHQATVNNGEKNAETIGPHFHANSTSQDAKLKGAESGNVRKQEPLSLLDKYLPQKQQLDLTCQGSTKSSGSSATLTNVEPAIVGIDSSPNVMKASTRDEGSISTTSALTKLTTRLNFLKERRNQIANELQNREKSHGSRDQSLENLDKGRCSGNQSPQSLDNGRGSENKSPQNMDKGKEGQSLQILDRGKILVSQSHQNPDKDRRSGQSY